MSQPEGVENRRCQSSLHTRGRTPGPAQVETAVRYYAEYQGEVDSWIAQSQAIAERERELWNKREAALTR